MAGVENSHQEATVALAVVATEVSEVMVAPEDMVAMAAQVVMDGNLITNLLPE